MRIDDRAGLALYGKREIEFLCNRYSSVIPDFDKNLIKDEWTKLKACIQNLRRQRPLAGIEACYAGNMVSRFPNILKLYAIAMVIPVSSACCERGFSSLKRIKSDWRSSLATEQVDRLMLVSLQGPTFDDYEAEGAMNKWWTNGQRSRRPLFEEEGRGDSDDIEKDLLNFMA